MTFVASSTTEATVRLQEVWNWFWNQFHLAHTLSEGVRGTRQSHKKYDTLHLLYWVVREDTNFALFVVLKRHVKLPDADFCVSEKKKRQHSEVRVKITSSKPKSEDNLTKTKVNMGQQHGQVNSGSLNSVQSLPPGCELKKRNVRCQQKNTRRWIEWVDTPSKEKKKKTDMPNSFSLLDTSISSTESSDENCDLTAFSTPIYWEIYARTLIC